MIRTFRTVSGLLALLGSGLAMAGPVNINTADAATLAAELKGVGKSTAAAIVAYRTQNGPFREAGDLRKVKGIGDKLVERNRGNILTKDSAASGK